MDDLPIVNLVTEEEAKSMWCPFTRVPADDSRYQQAAHQLGRRAVQARPLHRTPPVRTSATAGSRGNREKRAPRPPELVHVPLLAMTKAQQASAAWKLCRMSNIDTLAATMLMALARHVDFAAACLVAPYDDVPDAGHAS